MKLYFQGSANVSFTISCKHIEYSTNLWILISWTDNDFQMWVLGIGQFQIAKWHATEWFQILEIQWNCKISTVLGKFPKYFKTHLFYV